MRLIVLNDYGFVNGGASKAAVASVNALADIGGMEVCFVSAVGPVDPAIDARRVAVVNFGSHDLTGNPSLCKAAIHGLWNGPCAKRFAKTLNGCDPANTVVHLHTWVKSLSSSVVRVTSQKGFPIVCTLHDYFTVCPNGGLYNYPEQRLCTLTPMSLSCVLTNCDARCYAHKCWRVLRQVIQEAWGGVPGRIRHYITVSGFCEALLKPFLPKESIFYRIGNPIDARPSAPAAPERHDAFTYVGRLSPEKGPIVFARALRHTHFAANVVGAGPQAGFLQKAAPRARFWGWRPHADVAAIVRESRAIVFPSLCPETQGLVVAEAAAIGVPAIVSDTCAAREMVVDGVSGLLFRAGDSGDLAAKMRMLHADPHRAAMLGKAAYDRYWSNPDTIVRHANRLVECYRRVLADR